MSEHTLVLRVCPSNSEGDLWAEVSFTFRPASGPPGFHHAEVSIDHIRDNVTRENVPVTDGEMARVEEQIVEVMERYQ